MSFLIFFLVRPLTHLSESLYTVRNHCASLDQGVLNFMTAPSGQVSSSIAERGEFLLSLIIIPARSGGSVIPVSRLGSSE